MATNVGSISYTLELDTSKFDASLASIKSKLAGVSNSFSGLGSAAKDTGDSANTASLGFGKLSLAFAAGQLAAGVFTSALGGIKNAIGESFNALKSLETSRASFEVLTGSAEKATAVLKDVAGFAAKTPFEFPDLAQATKTLLGYGSTSSGVFNQVKQLADVTAATGGNLGQLSLIFGQIQAKGKLTGEEFRQLNQSGAAFGDIIAKELNIPLSELDSQIEKGNISFEDFQRVLSVATGEGGKFFGGTEKLAQTLDGRISTLKDTFTGLVGSFLGIDFTTGLVDADGLFAQISDSVKELSDSLSNVDLGDIGKKVADVFKFIIDNKGVVGPVLLGIAAGLTAIGLSLSLIAFNPVVLGIGAAIAALVFLETKFGVFSKLYEVLKPFIDFLGNEFKKAFDETKAAFDRLAVALQPFIDQLKIALAPVIQFIKDNFEQLKPVLDIFIALFSGPLMAIFAPVILAFTGLFVVLKLLPPIIDGIVASINFFTSVYNTAKDIVTTVSLAIGNAFNSMYLFITNIIAQINAVINSIAATFNSVSNSVRGVINNIIGAISGLAGSIGASINGVIATIRGFIGRFTDAGADLIRGLVNGIKSGIGAAISAIGGAAAEIKNKFTSALGIKSPSTVFTLYGSNIVQGLVNGIVKNISSAEKALVGLTSVIAPPTLGATPLNSVLPANSSTQSSSISGVNLQPNTIANSGVISSITPQKQVIITALPISGIQLTKEQLRDFYRELTTAYGEDLGAIV